MSLKPADTANQLFIIATFQIFAQNAQDNLREMATDSLITSPSIIFSVLYDLLEANYWILWLPATEEKHLMVSTQAEAKTTESLPLGNVSYDSHTALVTI